MRTLLCVGIGFAFVGSLAAQSDSLRDQCLGGTLISIRPDSITLKNFNDKVTTIGLARNAEIWRRGVDLESIQQLVIGDEIYLECSRDASGAVAASMVAAPDKDHGVDMVPHHISEIRVCAGHLIAIAKDTLSMRNEDGICIVHVNADTKIRRGGDLLDTSGLRLGDEVSARMSVVYPNQELTADWVEANVAKTEGTIVAVRSDGIVVEECHDNGVDPHPCLLTTVLFDAHTKIDLDAGKLKKGAFVMAIGLDLGRHTMRGSTITVEK